MKTFTSVIAIFKFSLLFSFAIANPFKSAISCDESAPSKFRVPQQQPIVDSHVSTDALDPSMLPQVYVYRVSFHSSANCANVLMLNFMRSFTLFTQEDCVFDAAQSRCNTSPQPSYPVWTGELIGVPQLAVDFTSTKTKALLYLRDGYLVLADSTTPKIYTISHLNPMSRINGAPLDIGPCFGYVRSDYPDYRYPQFDIYSLPDNTSVGIKQRSTPARKSTNPS